jgi:hypothetical protein
LPSAASRAARRRFDDPRGGEFEKRSVSAKSPDARQVVEQAIGDHLLEGACRRRIEPEILVEISPADARRLGMESGHA